MRKTIIPPSPVSLGDVTIAVKVEPMRKQKDFLTQELINCVTHLELKYGWLQLYNPTCPGKSEPLTCIQLPYPLNVPLLVRETIVYDSGRVHFVSDCPDRWIFTPKISAARMPREAARFTLTFHSVDAMQYKDRPEGTISKGLWPDEWAFVYRGTVTLINKNI